MAESSTPVGGGINWLSLINPQMAAQQQSIARQQALAAQLMQSGSQDDPTNQLANPGGFVVPYSPLQGIAKAGKEIAGAYIAKDSDQKTLDMYQKLGQSMGMQGQGAQLGNMMSGGPNINGNPYNIGDIMASQINPEGYKAKLALLNAGPMKAAETSNTPYVTPQGTYQMGSQIMGGPSGTQNISPSSNIAPSSALAAATGANSSPMSPQGNGGPVVISGAADAQPQPDKVPSAADGKPLLPDLSSTQTPDPSGTPKFKTENTKTGVEQTIQDQKDAAEGNKAFATMSQSLGQEKARLDNLIQVYKDVQSGTLTAQNPEFFNKMAALGFKDDPQSIKDLAGIQNATQNHILQVIQQIKDTNANAGGGAPTRTFGSEISQLLENGESTKGQPEALWNVIGQAKGVVDHHLDMVNGWIKSGGLGNRLAGGYTMRPDDYATQFSTSHNISDYRDKALKEMGPFKGMAGNNGENRISIIDPNGTPGTIDKAHLQSLINAGGKLAQ